MDGQHFDGNQTLMCIANGRYYGGSFNPVPDAEPDDGLLDVIVIKGDSPIETIRTIFHFIKRNNGSYPPGVVYFKSDDVTLYSYSEESTDIDGQPGPRFPVHITCEAGALRVICPVADRRKKRSGK